MIQDRARGPFAAGEIDRRGRDSAVGDFGVAQAIPQPATFGEAFDAARRDQTETRNHNVRQWETENELWERHRAIEEAIGRNLALPQSLTGEPTDERDSLSLFMDRIIPADRINAAILGRPGSLTDDAYEQQIEALRAEHPDAFRSIETREALQRRLEERWLGVRSRAEATAESGGWGAVGSFTGSLVGAFQDPPTAATTIVTGGAGASRPLLQRMLVQGAIGAGWEAFEAPDRAHDAAVYGGPAYTAAEGGADIVLGGLAPAGFEAGGAAARWATRPLRQAAGLHADPVTAALAREIDRSSRTYARRAALADEPILRGVGRRLEALDRDALLSGASGRTMDDVTGDLDAWRMPAAPEPPRDLSAYFDTPVSGQRASSVDIDGRLVRTIHFGEMGAADRALIQFEGRDGARRLMPSGSGPETADAAPAFVFRAADGWSEAEAGLIAGLRQARALGDAWQAADLIQKAGSMVDPSTLPFAGVLADEARGLARLAPGILAEAREGGVPSSVAAVVGEMSGARPDLQRRILAAFRAEAVNDARLARLTARNVIAADFSVAGDPPSPGLALRQMQAVDTFYQAPDVLKRLLGRAQAGDSWGYGLPGTDGDMVGSADLAAVSILERLLGPDVDHTGADLVGAVRQALDEADRQDAYRASLLTARAPTAAARDVAARFADAGGEGQRGQLAAKPEEVDMEANPEWDDLAPVTEERRVVDALRPCAPGAA